MSLESSLNIEKLVHHLESRPATERGGITFELWIKPQSINTNYTNFRTPIFTIGTTPSKLDKNNAKATDSEGHSDCTENVDLQLRQNGRNLELEYKTDHYRILCNFPSHSISPPLSGDMVHVVLSFSNDNQAVYLNGIPSSDSERLAFPFDSTNLGHWNRSSTLKLFSNTKIGRIEADDRENEKSWKGKIYSFAIHDAALGEDHAQSLFRAGLPTGPAVALNLTAIVAEDAAPPDGFFSLKVYNLETELSDLYAANNITSSRYDTEGVLIAVIHTLPVRGDLLDRNGIKISAAGEQIKGPNFELVYVPPQNQHSLSNAEPFASFEYFVERISAETERIFEDDNFHQRATVTIYVTAENDPPIAISSRFALPAGDNHTKHVIIGKADIDDTRSSLRIFLTKYPNYGHLYDIKTDGSYGDIIPLIQTGQGAFIQSGKLGYRYEGTEIPIDSSGLVGTDWLHFSVEDTSGARSKSGANITFEIYSALRGVPSTSFTEMTALEDDYSRSEIKLRGWDWSGWRRNVRYQILSLPTYGRLFEDSDASNPLVEGSILAQIDTHPYWGGVTLLYESQHDFFNCPSITPLDIHQNESFEFRVVTVSEGIITGASTPAVQEVKVRNVNDAPILTVPRGEFEVEVFSALRWNETNCSKNAVAAMQCRSRHFLYEIAVEDRDHNMNYVRVDVNSSAGMVSLNPSAIHLADFASCSMRDDPTHGWKCHGSGRSDESMTFLAKPDHAKNLLSGMSFESVREGRDEIVIAIYDGEGGECLSDAEHNIRMGIPSDESENCRGSVHHGCMVSLESIPFNVVKSPSWIPTNQAHSVTKIIPLQLWVAIIGIASAVLASLTSRMVNSRTHCRLAPSTRTSRKLKKSDEQDSDSDEREHN